MTPTPEKEACMKARIDRRGFLRSSALLGGVALLGPGRALAATDTLEWLSPVEVDPTLFAGINRVRDPQSLSPLEKKHAPVVRVLELAQPGKAFAVEVAVGEVLHPMTDGHHIHYVELFAGNEPAGRLEFSRTLNEPRATFYLVLDRSATLVVREYCNLHGLWESRMNLMTG
jgi:superoxide reductase